MGLAELRFNANVPSNEHFKEPTDADRVGRAVPRAGARLYEQEDADTAGQAGRRPWEAGGFWTAPGRTAF